MTPLITIHNAETGEVITREMNSEELSQRQIDDARFDAKAKEEAELEAAKASLLEKLGITEEEAKLLLS